jgi:hypothetical protein
MQERTIDVTRRISADPTSAVLLLAAPAAIADLVGIDRPIEAVIRTEPPVRTPTSFLIRFSSVAESVPGTDGTLTLTYASTEDDGGATDAQLSLSVAPGADERFVAVLHDLAGTFLDNLAAAAEQRSRAA